MERVHDLRAPRTAGAFQNDDDGIYQLLLDAGADPDVADPDGDFPPLLWALGSRKSKVGLL